MGAVTALRAGRRGQVSVFVDGVRLCGVSEALVATFRLYKGRDLSDAELDDLVREASRERVLADAHRLLAQRQRSRAELRERLRRKGHTAQAIAQTLDRLSRDGLLDDTTFAEAYVADKRRLNGWGAVRIHRGLAALGVSAADIEAALGGSDDERDAEELARAMAVLRKMGPPGTPLDAARRRAYQALLRRGFAGGLAYAAVKRWSGEEPTRD